MGLPLYLAMSGLELAACQTAPEHTAWMACQFSPYSLGLSNIPQALPPGSLLMVSDYFPCQGHSPDLVARQLKDALSRLDCSGLVLDFQRPQDPESANLVRILLEDLPCPAAVTEGHCEGLSCPVFLAPAPLHIPLETYLAPWSHREIWLEAALCQEQAEVTAQGCTFSTQFPPEGLSGGFYDQDLRCCYRAVPGASSMVFTLYDTQESLPKKLDLAASMGVTRAVGLYQELG